MILAGVDFTSAPSRRKPVVVATGEVRAECLHLTGFKTFITLAQFADWLQAEPAWLATCDLPFSLPRALVEWHGWPLSYPDLIQHLQQLSRDQLRVACKAYCDAHPPGQKFAHRQTDRPAGSSPSMKWINPPVAIMLHAGVPLLLQANATLPGMLHGHPQRIALEAYPGMVARSITTASYKNDQKQKQTEARLQARVQILQALQRGETRWRLTVDCDAFTEQIIQDGSGDHLDALLCLLLAGWAWQRRDHNWGLPAFDALEGWIAGCDICAADVNSAMATTI